MKPLYQYINEASSKEDFIKKVQASLDKAIKDKTIDAWFFNWADEGKKEKTAAEKYISSILPGKWEFIEITGNATNVGVGWFKNKENNVTISLSCDNEVDEDYIDSYTIE